MSIKVFKATDRTQLTTHFNVSEFRCKCGGTHDTKLDIDLVEKLEKLHTALNCSQIVVNSGYRCPTHSVDVGGSSSDYHTKGYAADIVCYDKNNNKISSRIVSCAAQDLGFNGIANIDGTYTATHVDTRTSGRWLGDEVVTKDYSVTDDFYTYYKISRSETSATISKGIDVSEHQGLIDWEKVKSDGLQFAILRAGYGREYSQIDKQFERNYSECKRLGIPVGAYWYSYAETAPEAVQEATVCLSVLAGKSFEYPVIFDIEENKSLANASELCSTFCSEIEKAGYYAAVYSFKSAFEHNISSSIKEKYDVFLSHIGVEQTDYNGSFGLWQYSWTGKVSGISGDVDLDYSYKNYPAIIKSARLNGCNSSDTEKKSADVTVTVDGITYSGTVTET